MSDTFVVRVTLGDGRTLERALGAGTYMLGRDQGHIVLGDASVSARHAQLEIGTGGVLITDLQSRNGTIDIHGQRLTRPTPLEPLQPVRLGLCSLVLLTSPAGGVKETVALEVVPPVPLAAPAPVPVHPPVQRDEHARAPEHAHAHEHGFLAPVLWPFRQHGELERMWWLVLVDYIPIVNFLVLRGWQLEVVRRMSTAQKPLTPPFARLPHLILQGLLLWTMTGVYALFPLVLISVFGLGGIVDTYNDTLALAGIIGGKSSQTLGDFVANEVIDGILAMGIELVWIPISFVLYRAAMIRYAVTGSVGSFFHPFANLVFVAQNLGAFALIYLYTLMLFGMLAVLSALLIATGIGTLLIPLITLPLYYSATAFEYGQLGKRLHAKLV